MNIDRVKKTLEQKPNSLGMTFVSTPEPDSCMAMMTVGEQNCQPYGYLSGGASLALAEQ